MKQPEEIRRAIALLEKKQFKYTKVIPDENTAMHAVVMMLALQWVIEEETRRATFSSLLRALEQEHLAERS